MLHGMCMWHVACGMWHVACGMWHVACGMWHVACGMWHVHGMEHRACARHVHCACAARCCDLLVTADY